MISVFLTGVLLLGAGWYVLYGKGWMKNLHCKLWFAQEYVYAGGQAQIIEQIENHKRMPVPVLEIAFRIDKGVVFTQMENAMVSDYLYKRDVFSLLGSQRIRREITLKCQERGYYPVDHVELRSFSVFYDRKYAGEQKVDAALYVYAGRVDVSDIIMLCERLMGTLQCARKLYEDPFAFHAIREYTSTDPMRVINWKASARTGEMMVNTYDSTLTQQVMIYLDVEDRGIYRQDHLIEEGISVAACLAQRLLGQGLEVGISVNLSEPVRIEPGARRGQLRLLEQMLCRINRKERMTAYQDILTDLPTDAFPVFITRDGKRNQDKIESFLQDKYGLWVYPQDAGERTAVSTGRNLHCVVREVTAY
ncbi:DUF58 domain-containing protein [bacterium 0.1xD8-71]|nr:DUF58 domain-containing protein [bacterium 0.1xD8-71]